ncbi:MAG: hypothetical protein RLZZ293_409 [Pseudomonadota bacterium]|jgi:hypothetical protein
MKKLILVALMSCSSLAFAYDSANVYVTNNTTYPLYAQWKSVSTDSHCHDSVDASLFDVDPGNSYHDNIDVTKYSDECVYNVNVYDYNSTEYYAHVATVKVTVTTSPDTYNDKGTPKVAYISKYDITYCDKNLLNDCSVKLDDTIDTTDNATHYNKLYFNLN